jgi:heme/copper-type cytochrome/quinol oxidase subunit 1
LFTAIIFFVVGLFYFNYAVDIHLHDTYFIFRLSYFIWAFYIILLLFWTLCLFTKNILYSNTLSWIHVLLTIVSCILLLIFPSVLTNVYEGGLASMPRRYYDIGQSKTYSFFSDISQNTFIIACILVVGQFTYLINLVIGIYKRLSKQNNR